MVKFFNSPTSAGFTVPHLKTFNKKFSIKNNLLSMVQKNCWLLIQNNQGKTTDTPGPIVALSVIDFTY